MKDKTHISTNKWLYNFQYTGIIASQIHNAKIIHTVRNPKDKTGKWTSYEFPVAELDPAEAKGLKNERIFFNYAIRNAILPQVTALALSLSHIISGAILVEIVFSYPGIGSLLYQAIKSFDYFIIQGVVLILVISIAFSMLIIDLIYPLIDPRIKISNV